MAQFKPQTRGDSSPQGKPHVYFCAHPRDFGLLNGIAEEILSRQNCAVWYDTEPEAPYDEELFFTDLGQMNLFVMPVTTRLLTTPNRARDVEFPYAMEHHIPVLPLMQERGLEELFNRVCGDLQFLTKLDPDPTAIPYEEKLTRYLQSVLIGDELTARVRAAFDAHIFLSYRKKDRALAQELMRLIHRNDFCRDMAIWYDEFLTPGENFNEAIERALKECDLFALAVTPNLVNEKNYVMTTEYPMAREADKTILPAEVAPTDRDELVRLFAEIPDGVDARNPEALAASLAQTLEGTAKRENDNDPAHNFLIGLAYLNGIDVEVDRERAVMLITEAAKAGIPQAIKKLVSMYREGEGVERNYETAIEWQRKLVEWWRKIYEQEPSESAGLDLFNALWNLGDYMYELRRMNDAGAIYQDMNQLAEEMNTTYASAEIWRNLSISWNKLGNIRKAQGDLEGSEYFFAQALNIAGALAQGLDTPETKRDLAVSVEAIGNIRRAQGDLVGASAFYIWSLKIREALAQETGTVKDNLDLSISLDGLGDICKDYEDLDSAKDYYNQSLDIREALARETDTVEVYRNLSISFFKLGDIRKAQDDLDGAENYYTQSLNIRETIAQETDTIEAHRDLSISLGKLGDIRQAQGDLDGAENFLARSLGIAKDLTRKTKTMESCDDLASFYFKLATLRKPYDRKLLKKALAIYQVLIKQCPHIIRYRQSRDETVDALNSL